jgi:hypothetical protein
MGEAHRCAEHSAFVSRFQVKININLGSCLRTLIYTTVNIIEEYPSLVFNNKLKIQSQDSK